MEFFGGPKKLEVGKVYILKAHSDISIQQEVIMKFTYSISQKQY